MRGSRRKRGEGNNDGEITRWVYRLYKILRRGTEVLPISSET
jgi:hypothetical protein